MYHRMGHGHSADLGARLSRHLERMAEALHLSNDQRTQIQALQLTYAKEAIRGRAELAVMRLDLRQLLQAEQPDLTQVKTVLQQMAGKQTELRMARITLMLGTRSVLTPAQRQQWRTMRVQRMQEGPREP